MIVVVELAQLLVLVEDWRAVVVFVVVVVVIFVFVFMHAHLCATDMFLVLTRPCLEGT